MMDEELLQILACPACRGPLDPLDKTHPSGPELEGLACPACALVYPVRGQIPVLLKEESILRQEWEAGRRSARPNPRREI